VEAQVAADLAVEARGVVKRFGADVLALDGLDLRIEEGETYGLLGPNGAGKTTTLRMLLGLVRPTSGLIRVLGRRPGDPAALRQTGAMGGIAFYPFLSGRDNLRTVARRAGWPIRGWRWCWGWWGWPCGPTMRWPATATG
jgi:ABC-2 type transport system ATP-binding protein